MRDKFASTLEQMILDDPSIILLTGDLGFGVFDSFRENHPDNFLNVGVAEQNMTGIAAGLAKEGFKVFTYSIANFSSLRCLEQIRNDVAYHDLNVNVVSVGAGFSYGPLGMTHHATEDLSVMRAIPNITIFSPATLREVEYATKTLTNTPGAGYLRIDKSYYDEPSSIDENDIKIGKNTLIQDGTDVALLTTGGILNEVMHAAKELGNMGISCRVSSCHSIKPIDKEDIIFSARETKGIVTIEEQNILGGLGGSVAEICLESDIKPGFFRRIGLNDEFSSIVGSQEHLRKRYKLDSTSITRVVRDLLS